MTAEAKAQIEHFHSEQFALRDKVAARLAKSTPAERLDTLVKAGVLTAQGKLTASYRPRVAPV